MYDLTYTWNLKRVEFIETDSGVAVSRGQWGEENGEMLVKGYKLHLLGEYILEIYVQHGDCS